MSHFLVLSLLAQEPVVPSQGEVAAEAVTLEQDALEPGDDSQEGEISVSTQSDASPELRGNVGAPPNLDLGQRDRGASMYRAEDNRWNTHQVGDLVTVVIYDSLRTEVKADTTTKRSSGHESSIKALFGLVSQVLVVNPSMAKELGEGSFGAGGSSENNFTGSGETSRENAVSGVLTCTVVEVLESGNLRISGHKTVTVNGETQFLVLEGVVRPSDIDGDNSVPSDMLSDATIQTTGSGELADRQRSGFLARFFDRVFPF